MRFRLVARRVFLAAALGLTLASAVTACSSSSSSASTSSAPSSSAPASSASASSGHSNAAAQIKANWEAFFSGTTSAAKKISLLQNGQKFAGVIEAQAGSGLAKSASATVTAVSVTSPTKATVTYDILLAGKPALTHQTGQAVHQDGTWKVGDASFCALLTLENGGKVIGAAYTAFHDGLHVALYLSAGLMLGTGLLALVTLRPRPLTGEGNDQDSPNG